MHDIRRRGRALLNHKRRDLEARYPRLRAPAPAKAPQYIAPSTDRFVVLGSDEAGQPFRLDERSRLEHMHVIGTTGSGKTTLIEHMARQDILNGRGVCVLDPHGGHPGSLFRRLLTWLGASGLAKSRVVHVLDPNITGHVTGFNPLTVPPGYDPAVIAEAVLEAFQRLWSDEDPDSKPTIQRVLAGTFTALAELGLTLAEAELLFDPRDLDGVREYLIGEVRDDYAREELSWLHMMGLGPGGVRDLRVEVTGPRNRIGKLVRLAALKTIVGQTERVMNLRRALDENEIILANLAGGARAYEKGSDILGRLLVRFLLFHAKRRQRPDVPYFVYLDECQRYLSGDVPTLLAEVRKQGIGFLLAHQWQSQLATVDEEILSAVRSGTNIKVVYRVKDQKEAVDLAEMVMPLNLERPVEALTKETVVGHEVRHLRNSGIAHNATRTHSAAETRTIGTGLTRTKGSSEGTSTTVTESEQESFATTTGWSSSEAFGTNDSHGNTISHVETDGETEIEGRAVSHGVNRGRGHGMSEQSGMSSGESFSQSFDVPVDPWRSGEGAYGAAVGLGMASGRNVSAGYSGGRNHAAGNSESWSDGESSAETRSSQRGRTSSVAEGLAVSDTHGTSHLVTDTISESTTHGFTRGIAVAKGVNETRSKSTAHSRQESKGTTRGESIALGEAHSSGWSEAMVPIMALRPTSVHGKDNVLYMAAQTLRSLTTGSAFVNFVNHTGMNSALLSVPVRTMPTLSDDAFMALVEAIAGASPSAQPAAQAVEAVKARRLRLTKAAGQLRLPAPEPVHPKEFRVSAPRRKKRTSTTGD